VFVDLALRAYTLHRSMTT